MTARGFRMRYLTAALFIPLHGGILSRHAALFFSSAQQVSFSSSSSSSSSSRRRFFKTIQVHIAHRHGDRTPITPLKDQDYWHTTLPSSEVLDKMARGTFILRNEDDDESRKTPAHSASGIGPYGKLTLLGILQMIQVGTRLRDELFHVVPPSVTDSHSAQEEDHYMDSHGNVFLYKARLFHQELNPFDVHKLRVISTDFPRTIQSVQALLVGLLASEKEEEEDDANILQQQLPLPNLLSEGDLASSNKIQIDVRHTRHLIPDPQPRTSTEQVELEKVLTQRSHLLEKEQEMSQSAIRLTQHLRSLLDESHAFRVSFGIGEEKKDDSNNKNNDEAVLAWTQIAELITCLKARDLLPSSVSHQDHDMALQYVAWKWFENLSHPKLSKLAMGNLVSLILESLQRATKRNLESTTTTMEDTMTTTNHTTTNTQEEPSLYIYSCHDSSLIGLICAFRLEQPAQWPEYGSFFKIELIECREYDSVHQDMTMMNIPDHLDDNAESCSTEYFVRFSLNGQVLKTSWGIESEEENYHIASQWNMIPLDHLASAIQNYYQQEEES